ncbi:hypothetical protein ACVWXP_003781 [Bradyrhizobium sp. USDA 4463]
MQTPDEVIDSFAFPKGGFDLEDELSALCFNACDAFGQGVHIQAGFGCRGLTKRPGKTVTSCVRSGAQFAQSVHVACYGLRFSGWRRFAFRGPSVRLVLPGLRRRAQEGHNGCLT